jgi:hypothetical protein
MYICICICIYAEVNTCVSVFIFSNVHAYVLNAFLYVCMPVWYMVCTYACMYIRRVFVRIHGHVIHACFEIIHAYVFTCVRA